MSLECPSQGSVDLSWGMELGVYVGTNRQKEAGIRQAQALCLRYSVGQGMGPSLGVPNRRATLALH